MLLIIMIFFDYFMICLPGSLSNSWLNQQQAFRVDLVITTFLVRNMLVSTITSLFMKYSVFSLNEELLQCVFNHTNSTQQIPT